MKQQMSGKSHMLIEGDIMECVPMRTIVHKGERTDWEQ